MAVRASKQMAERLKGILMQDKIGVGQGFVLSLKGDSHRLLSDYFLLDGEPQVSVLPDDDGGYSVKIEARARAIKAFDTTVGKIK